MKTYKTYTAKAFVRIKDADEREEMINKIEGFGYKIMHSSSCLPCLVINHILGGYEKHTLVGDFLEDINVDAYSTYVDCGTDAQLLLELAKMRDDTDEEQWFIGTLLTTDMLGGNIIQDVVLTKGIGGIAKCNPTTKRMTPQQVADNWSKIKNLL